MRKSNKITRKNSFGMETRRQLGHGEASDTGRKDKVKRRLI